MKNSFMHKLTTSIILNRSDTRADPTDFSIASYCKTAYKRYLGRGNRKVTPSCVVLEESLVSLSFWSLSLVSLSFWSFICRIGIPVTNSRRIGILLEFVTGIPILLEFVTCIRLLLVFVKYPSPSGVCQVSLSFGSLSLISLSFWILSLPHLLKFTWE